MTDDRILFPFDAVVGQHDAKLALLLNAVDPRIGGVLLRGHKGTAKSTLARGLAALLDRPFVELPLGATEDRVIGSIDVGAALGGDEVRLLPGLLAAADGGMLYVDEVNLLADHLVDALLDVAASGVNRIEREGVSHTHDSRFVLIGSMNPEEGERRRSSAPTIPWTAPRRCAAAWPSTTRRRRLSRSGAPRTTSSARGCGRPPPPACPISCARSSAECAPPPAPRDCVLT